MIHTDSAVKSAKHKSQYADGDSVLPNSRREKERLSPLWLKWQELITN